MSAKYKILKHVAETHKQIEKLDEQIIALEKMADLAAQGTFGVRVKLELDVERKEEEKQKKVAQSPTQSWYEEMQRYMMMSPGIPQEREEKKSPTVDFSDWISESTAFKLLQFMLDDKKIKRDILERRVDHLMNELLIQQADSLIIQQK
jgi:hypothetical protein